MTSAAPSSASAATSGRNAALFATNGAAERLNPTELKAALPAAPSLRSFASSAFGGPGRGADGEGPREGSGEQAAPGSTLNWPLTNAQSAGLSEELSEMMELDIFAERKRLPEMVEAMVRSHDASVMLRQDDGKLRISRAALDTLQEEDLQELLMRVGEEAGGTRAELSERVFGLLSELLDVARASPTPPDWELLDDEDADEQRVFARVFSPEEVAEILVKARTQDVTIVDLRGVGEMRFTDYFVVATARSDRHLMASAGAVVYSLKQRCMEVVPGKAPTVEGDVGSKWVCVDAGSIVAHVFLGDEARDHFDLEGLWYGLGAPIVRIEQPETIHTIDTMRLESEG